MLRNATVWLVGSTTQTAGRPLGLGEGGRRNLDDRGRAELDGSRHGGPEPHRLRWLREPDLDLERPGRGIRLRRDFSDAARGPHRRVVGQRRSEPRGRGRRADELGRHVEHGVAPALAGDLDDHLPG